MLTPDRLLASRFQPALQGLGAPYAGWDPELRPATRPEFGHFQTNLPVRLAKPLGLPPREVADRLLAGSHLEDVCLPPTFAGAGFLNLTLRPEFLAGQVTALLADPHLGVAQADPPRRVVVDHSSPNVAKQMHVGHLRSTVIGDALARVFAAVGDVVVRQNHVGDWGTQFGMLIEHLLEEGHDGADPDLSALDGFYRQARERFDADPGFAGRARARVVALQSGDPRTHHVWRRLVDTSMTSFAEVYARLGSGLTPADTAGESSYATDLAGVVDDLRTAGLLVESDGASCVFPRGFANRDGEPLPVVVRKSDGGYGYDATDLAALRHRVTALRADRIVYVVDARQALHFDQVFAVAREAGWLPEEVTVQHVAFGTVLGEDGRPFRTRTGGTVPLSALLDAAESRAAEVLGGRGSRLDASERTAVVRAVGIGAVKYADLVNGLGRDYVFSLERMVAMDGNTGPYLQYAHARAASLLERSAIVTRDVSVLDHPAEVRLALLLTGFPGAVASVAETLEPHRLCGHLHQVATALSAFYEACPVLSAEGEVRASRLALCRATREVLAAGLGLLGIDAPERM
ncbi:arginine--tRNA ligase [Kineococcus sp. GCM10028916]|uniref:arginine--tRNA ligase n=1 Tax=Kineococcus sp. GCM10028916 TaxID=3273394 RepID=UPI003632C06B